MPLRPTAQPFFPTMSAAITTRSERVFDRSQNVNNGPLALLARSIGTEPTLR